MWSETRFGLLAAVLWATTATAEEPHLVRHDVNDSGWFVESRGDLRFIGSLPPDLQVDPFGTMVGQGPVLDSRLRAYVAGGWKDWKLATEWDLFAGQLAGDTWDIPGEEDSRRRDALTALSGEGFLPRRISLQGRVGDILSIEAGLIPANTWGLGILANGGEALPFVGRVDRGDRMIRLRMTTGPLRGAQGPIPVFLTLAADRVVEDDLARMSDGQEAWHAVASALWAEPNGRRLGVFFTYRHQLEPRDGSGVTDDDRRKTAAAVIDVYGDLPVMVGDWRLRFAAEAAGIAGTTKKILTYGDLERTRIRSAGAALEIDVTEPGGVVGLHLRTGWASGSGDSDRGILQDFSFDGAYNVGLVLFDELGGSLEAGTYALLQDPEHSGQGPDGAEILVSEGSVRRATYLWPAVTVEPLDWLDLRLGFVAAWGSAPVSQAFTTYRAGGEPRNQLDEPTSGYAMGTELHWQVGLGRGLTTERWLFRPQLAIQGGHAFPSANLGGGSLHKVMATARLRW